MKIITKFKDYYDSAMSLGIDETIHFIREVSTVNVDKKMDKILKPRGYSSLNGDYKGYRHNKKYGKHKLLYYKQSFVFFCGKLYPVLYVNYSTLGDRVNKEVGEYIHGYNKCLNFFKKLQGNSKPYWSFSDEVEIFKLITSSITESLIFEEHIKYKSPILSYNQLGINGIWQVTLNAELKGIEFYKMVDSYTAFQEISMFLGSTLCDVSTPKMPVGDDKVILNSKGFDPKYGFRTRPKK